MQEEYNDVKNYLDYPYQTPPFNISDKKLLLSFDSFKTPSGINKGPIFFNINGMEDSNFGYTRLESYNILPYPGRMVLIYVKPIITITYLLGVYYYHLDLNPQLEQFPINLEPNQFRIGIQSRSDIIESRKEDRYDCKYIILPVIF
jgi:hypothetical protein